jgi:hypothetical protein
MDHQKAMRTRPLPQHANSDAVQFSVGTVEQSGQKPKNRLTPCTALSVLWGRGFCPAAGLPPGVSSARNSVRGPDEYGTFRFREQAKSPIPHYPISADNSE